jgi:hypothetical protein
MFGFDTDQGIFLMEELEYDEYGASTGTLYCHFIFQLYFHLHHFYLIKFNPNLKTRLYDFQNLRDKRFSSIEVDMLLMLVLKYLQQ